MERFKREAEKVAMLVAATSAFASLSSSAPAQGMPGTSHDPLSQLSFQGLEQYRQQKMRADLGLGEAPSLFSLLPGKKLELNFGQNMRFALSEDRYSFAYGSKGFNAGFDKLNFKGRASLTQLSLQSQLGFGASRLSLMGYRVGDDSAALDRQSLQFGTGSAFSLKAERLSVDKDFNRMADLQNFSPEEKKRMEAERGFERMDLSAQFNPTKGLSFSTDRFSATGKDTDIRRSGYRDLASLSFLPGSSLSYLREGSSYASGGQTLDERSHELFSFGFANKGLSLSALQDVQKISTPGNNTEITTQSLRLDGKGTLPFQACGEMKNTEINAYREKSQLFDLSVQPLKSFSMHARMQTIDRNQGESSNLTAVDWAANLNPRLRFTGVYSNFTSDAGNSLKVTRLALQGEPVKGIAFSGIQESQAGERFGDRNVVDFSLQTTRPFSLRPLEGFSFSGRYFSSELNGAEEAEIGTANLSGTVKGFNFGVDYLSLKDPSGLSRKEQSITISRNGGEKEKIRGTIQYKIRDSTTTNVPPRSINAQLSYKVNSTSQLQLKYALRPENEKREPLPVNDYALSYNTTVGKLRYDAQLGQCYDYARDFRSTRFQLSATGTLNNGASLSASAGFLMEDRGVGGKRTLPTFGLNYDRKVSENDFISLQSAYNERGWQLKLEAKHKF